MSDLNSDGLTALLALCRNDRITEVAQAIRDSEWLKDHDASVRRDAQADGVFMAQEELVKRDQFTMRTLDILSDLEDAIRRNENGDAS